MIGGQPNIKRQITATERVLDALYTIPDATLIIAHQLMDSVRQRQTAARSA